MSFVAVELKSLKMAWISESMFGVTTAFVFLGLSGVALREGFCGVAEATVIGVLMDAMAAALRA
jgi:hypothetical protein